MNNKTTGAFISARRKELSLNQKQLAEKLGVTDKAVSKWETGRSAPDIALLEPLARELGVSVVEILQGEKIKEENFPAVSDKVVVKTMKKDKQKLRRSVTIAVSTVILIIYLLMLSYPAYHYFTTVPVNDEKAVIKEISKYWVEREGKNLSDFRIIESEKKSDYYFVLFTDGEEAYVALCEQDAVFKDRMSWWGGTGVKNPNEIGQYCTGYNAMTFNIFFGHGMTDKEYSYYYQGSKVTKPIEDEYFMDTFIDVDDSWSPPNLIYND